MLTRFVNNDYVGSFIALQCAEALACLLNYKNDRDNVLVMAFSLIGEVLVVE